MCLRRFEQCGVLDAQLENIHSPKPTTQLPGCPDNKTWFDIASGVMEPSQALAQVQHASGCDHCGRLLHEAVADLRGELSEQDAELLAALPSARKRWQRRLAQRMAGKVAGDSSQSWWSRWTAIPRIAPAAIALVAVLGGTWWLTVHQKQPAAARSLLAQAYTEQRTMELRIAGAEYAQPKVQLGPSGSFLARSEELLKAESLIADQMVSHPADPAWLQAKAQADLLEGRYDPAVESLRHAVQLAPKSSGLLIDLATAYFQRGQVANQPEDYGAAYEQLSRALATQPDSAVALFNRAIVCEHQFLYQQALEDWEHYLRVDPGSQWSNEARQRADAVRAKLKERGNNSAPLTPEQIASRVDDPNLHSEIEAHSEEYLDLAVRSWLPDAYPENGLPANPSARTALFFLAQLTARQHGDLWLSDLLRGAVSPVFPAAIGALSGAVRATSIEEFGLSEVQADKAYRRFHSAGNFAGVLRAQSEWVYAAQLNRQSEECRKRATIALKESERYPYVWLHIQLGLEAGVCSGLMGDLGADVRLSQLAMDRAKHSGYPILYLRAMGFVSGDELESGERASGWKLNNEGLQHFWSGHFPAMRGYNFYSNMAVNADATGRPNFQLAILREAVSLLGSNGDLLIRANAHNNAGDAATAAHQPQIAEQQYAASARLYALAPQTEGTRNIRIESDIRSAQLEGRRNKLDSALDHLTRVQAEIQQLSNDYLAEIFYSTLGEIQLRRGRPEEAEQALRAALKLAERSLALMTNEADSIAWSKNAAPVYLGLAEAELRQGREQDSLEIFEWYLGAAQRAGTTRSASTNQREQDPSRLPSRLPLLSNRTVLAYGPLPDGLAIWIYDDRGVSAKWIPSTEQDWEELATRFYELASDPRSELGPLRRDGRELYDLLVAPIQPRLDPLRTLVIESEGWIARVPFEVLVDSDGRYLIERGPIVHSQGLYSDERLHHGDQVTADSPALIVASTAAPKGYLPPIGVRDLAEAVARNFHRHRLFTGHAATLRAVSSELQAATVFNFSGHSLVTPTNPGLMMEDKDPLTDNPQLLDANLVRRLNMPDLELAVLSACSTANDSEGDSSGFNSVASALLRAGVPHVVASRWAVDAVATRGFVEDFYHHLLSGMSVAEAVRTTSRRMIADPRTAHPYYWSAFAAYGKQ